MTQPDTLQNNTPQPTPNAGDAASAADAAQRTHQAMRRLGNPLLLAVLLAAGLLTWQWYNARQQHASQQAIEKRLNDADSSDHESRVLLKQAQEQNAALLARLGALEERLNEYAEQAGGLQSVYRDLALNRDAAVLAEAEHALTLAVQQLHATGNIAAASNAVQATDQRLARFERPLFAPVRKALARDLERLRSTPVIDVPGMNLRLENLMVGIDQLPLAMEARPAPVRSKTVQKPAEEGPLDKLLGSIWDELRGLIRVERMDAVTPVLLPAEQQFFVRENIKLRLLSARLSLQARDQNSFRHEIQAARDLLERHFDTQDKRVENTLAGLRQFAGTTLNTDLPSLQESLAALHQAQQLTDKKAKP